MLWSGKAELNETLDAHNMMNSDLQSANAMDIDTQSIDDMLAEHNMQVEKQQEEEVDAKRQAMAEQYKQYNGMEMWMKKIEIFDGVGLSDMLAIMKKQQVKTKIPRLFPGDVVIANKTGVLPFFYIRYCLFCFINAVGVRPVFCLKIRQKWY